MFRYRVYGIELASTMELALPVSDAAGPPDIELVEESEAFFRGIVGENELWWDEEKWVNSRGLQDGRYHLRYGDLWEFLIEPDGGRIWAGRLQSGEFESFQVYLLGQALSFSLVKQGIEPLHATAVTVKPDSAIAFLGDSGTGKSTIAAAFLAGGSQLLTDDLLCLKQSGNIMYAYPGPGRIKLFPEPAQEFLGAAGRGVEMNPDAVKRVISLPPASLVQEPVRLASLVFLQNRSTNGTTIVRRLDQQEAFFKVIGGRYNTVVEDTERLERNFRFSQCVVSTVPSLHIDYQRGFGRLQEVRDVLSKLVL